MLDARAWVLVLAFLLTGVAGHGYLGGVVANGKYYRGFNNTAESGIKPSPKLAAWTVDNPQMNAIYPPGYNTSDMACGISATPASQYIPIDAGSKIQFQWAPTWYDSHEGPITTWMARCNGDCTTVRKEDLEFFKIHEFGWIPGPPTWATGGIWATDMLMRDNLTWNVKIPETIASGNYVLRLEIIALQMAFAEGAEVYPACVNVQLASKGTEVPAGTKAAKLYDPAEEGFHVFLYSPISSYKIPGPPVWPGAISKT